MIKIYSQVKPDLLLHIIYYPDKKYISYGDPEHFGVTVDYNF